MTGPTFEFEAIGTRWRIDIADPMDDREKEDLRRRIIDRIDEFDAAYSRFRDDSLVAEMARRPGAYRLPDDATPMLALYRRMYSLTKGAMTPLVGRLLSDAGYDATYSLRPGTLRRPPAWEDVLEHEPPMLTLERPALLDLGAIGKGYLIDIVSGLIEDAGCRSYCVDAGGDMRHRDASGAEMRVGLEDPEDASKVIGVAVLDDRSICGSSGNRRAWDRFHHIIDPRSLESPRHLAAVWTVADTTMLADALSTALFFAGPERLSRYHDFEYLLMMPDRGIRHSPGFPAELYVQDAAGEAVTGPENG